MHTEMTTRKMAVVVDFPLNIIFCFENRQAHYVWREAAVYQLPIHTSIGQVSSHRRERFCLALVMSDPLSCQMQLHSYIRTQNLLNQFGGTILLLGVFIGFELNLAPQLWISSSSKGPRLLPIQIVTGHCPLGRARNQGTNNKQQSIAAVSCWCMERQREKTTERKQLFKKTVHLTVFLNESKPLKNVYMCSEQITHRSYFKAISWQLFPSWCEFPVEGALVNTPKLFSSFFTHFVVKNN